MKKILVVVIVLAIAVAAVAGVMVFRSITAQDVASAHDVSPKAAQVLQNKIDAVKKAEEDPKRPPSATRVELSEAELESYVLYSLREKIPAQIDSIDVQLDPGTIGADTQITFDSKGTGNPIVDALIGGTHNLFVKGKLAGSEGRGKFDLEEVRVDGIPVPNMLIQTLFKKYVKPKYPDADLNEPFDLPWGIEEITLLQRKAIVAY